MKIFFWVASILLILFGLMIFSQAESAIHEIEAFLLFLISSVMMVGAGIIGAIEGEGETVKNGDNTFEKAYEIHKEMQDNSDK